MPLARHCFALDLKNDPEVIAAYEKLHQKVWPQIIDSIKNAGVVNLEMYLVGNRMFMIMETDETFSFERKDEMDKSNPVVQEWEALMWTYQQALPTAKPGEKWVLMKKIFEL